MQIATDRLDALDLRAAIASAAPARGEFFPSRVEASAALHGAARLAARLKALLHDGLILGPPEVVWVPRRGVGSRPVPDAPFLTRVVMSALSDRLISQLAEVQPTLDLRSLGEHEEGARRNFEQQVLEDPNANWVALSDVASFYEYVDHAALRRDILEWTGDVALADATRDLLAEVMGRQFGLPQGPRASEVLADLYLSGVDRRLARLGLTAYRYNDDFMLAAPSHSAGEQMLAVLERTLRERGLAMNHAKGRLVSRETFGGWVEALQQKVDEARFAVAGGGFYEFDPEVFAGIELQEGDAETAVGIFEGVLAADRSSDPYFVNDRLLQKSLPVLAAGEDLTPLRNLATLAKDWAAHSRVISLYLRSMVGTEAENSMTEAVSPLIARTDISPWVRGWLLDPLARSTGPLAKSLIDWLRYWLTNPAEPWFVRGRAAIALARRTELPEHAVMGTMFENAPPQARADFLAAVLLESPAWVDDARRGWVGPDPMLRAVLDLFDSIAGTPSEFL